LGPEACAVLLRKDTPRIQVRLEALLKAWRGEHFGKDRCNSNRQMRAMSVGLEAAEHPEER
jgi:hypothetical protein